MAGKFARSWKLTKLTFSILTENTTLILFPLTSVIISSVLLLIIFFTIILPASLSQEPQTYTATALATGFLTLLIASFTAIFFNFAIVYATKRIFEHKKANFKESINYTLKRIHLVFLWALTVTIVGMIISILEGLARRMKGAGKIVTYGIRYAIGAAWSIATIFVVQAMVYHELKPIAAIKDSVRTFTKTWGETFIRVIGLGTVEALFILGGFVVFLAGLLTLASFGLSGIVLMASLGVVTVMYIIGVLIIFQAANSVFNTAIYHYAKTGKIPGNYTTEALEGAFKKTKKQ